MKRVITYAWLVGILTLGVYAADVIREGPWQVKCDKGEVLDLSYQGTPVVSTLGDFRVAGREVIQPFREVAELREKKADQLVYEGISDDGNSLYVEFGEVATVGRDFEFMVFTYWLPPSQWPADAVSGVIRFSPKVISAQQVPVPEKDIVAPNALDYLIKTDNGRQFRMRALFLDRDKSRLTKKDGTFVLEFEGDRDYVSNPEGMKKRSLSYWLRSTGTCYVKFVLSEEQGGRWPRPKSPGRRSKVTSRK